MPFDPTSARPAGFDATTAQPVKQPDEGGLSASGVVGKLYAAAHSFEDVASFGQGDKLIAGAVSAARGEPYATAYNRIKSNAEAASEANPITSFAGDVGGAIAGGGVLGTAAKAAEALPVAGRAVAAANRALTLQPGQRLANLGRTAAVGGGISAADAAARGGDADQITNAGLVGAVAGPVVGYAGAKLVKTLAPASQRAMQLLAGKIGEDPDTLMAAFQNGSKYVGRNLSMAEIVGLKARGELRQLAADNPIIGEAASRAETAADVARPQELQDKLSDIVGPAQDINALTTARKARMDTAMDPLRDQAVPIAAEHLDMLNDQRVRSAVRDDPQLRAKLNNVRDTLADDPEATAHDLTVNDIDSIRKSLRGRQAAYSNPASNVHNPHTAEKYGDLANSVAQIAYDAVPEYEQALGQFEKDSHYIRGFKHGMAGKTVGEADTPEMIRSLGTDEGQAGYATGFGSRAIGQAGESESSARAAAQRMSESGFAAHASEAVGPEASAAMQRLGRAQSTAAENLRTISPGTPKPEPENATGQLAHAAAAATYHSPTGIMYHLTRLVSTNNHIRMAPAVQAKISQMLFNPRTTEQGIRALRKAGAQNDDLRQLARNISGATGAAVGNSLTGG